MNDHIMSHLFTGSVMNITGKIQSVIGKTKKQEMNAVTYKEKTIFISHLLFHTHKTPEYNIVFYKHKDWRLETSGKCGRKEGRMQRYYESE